MRMIKVTYVLAAKIMGGMVACLAALAGMAPVTAFAQSQEMTCICEEKCSEGAVKGSTLLSWQPMWIGHIFIIISFSILPIWIVIGSFVTSGFPGSHCRDSVTLSVWNMDCLLFRKQNRARDKSEPSTRIV